jgi:NHL repeat
MRHSTSVDIFVLCAMLPFPKQFDQAAAAEDPLSVCAVQRFGASKLFDPMLLGVISDYLQPVFSLAYCQATMPTLSSNSYSYCYCNSKMQSSQSDPLTGSDSADSDCCARSSGSESKVKVEWSQVIKFDESLGIDAICQWCDGTSIVIAVSSQPARIEVWSIGTTRLTVSPVDAAQASQTNSEAIRIHSFQQPDMWKMPMGLALSVDRSTLYVSDYLSHTISALDTKSFACRVLVDSASRNATESLRYPNGIAIGQQDGLLYVADQGNHRIQVFKPKSGDYVRTIGIHGTEKLGRLHWPCDVAIDNQSNRVFVADRGNERVQLFDTNTGEPLGVMLSKGCEDFAVSALASITISQDGHLVTLVTDDTDVQVFGNDTRFITSHESCASHVTIGALKFPMYVHVDESTQDLLIADSGNCRVVRVHAHR